jgi:hypothetical protein
VWNAADGPRSPRAGDAGETGELRNSPHLARACLAAAPDDVAIRQSTGDTGIKVFLRPATWAALQGALAAVAAAHRRRIGKWWLHMRWVRSMKAAAITGAWLRAGLESAAACADLSEWEGPLRQALADAWAARPVISAFLPAADDWLDLLCRRRDVRGKLEAALRDAPTGSPDASATAGGTEAEADEQRFEAEVAWYQRARTLCTEAAEVGLAASDSVIALTRQADVAGERHEAMRLVIAGATSAQVAVIDAGILALQQQLLSPTMGSQGAAQLQQMLTFAHAKRLRAEDEAQVMPHELPDMFVFGGSLYFRSSGDYLVGIVVARDMAPLIMQRTRSSPALFVCVFAGLRRSTRSTL